MTMPESFNHAYADIGDVRLHYVTMGQGPAVVLLHGWPQTWYMWRDIIPGLATRWHHGLHWELDLPEELTAGREDIYLGFFYRTWGARPDAISAEAQHEYLRSYRQPGAMRAGFNLYRAMRQDVLDNEAFIAHGKLNMPVLCYGGSHGRGRGMSAIESWRRVATNVCGGIVENCGHWIPEERPEWVVEQLLAFFGEEPV